MVVVEAIVMPNGEKTRVCIVVSLRVGYARVLVSKENLDLFVCHVSGIGNSLRSGCDQFSLFSAQKVHLNPMVQAGRLHSRQHGRHHATRARSVQPRDSRLSNRSTG